MLKGLHNSVEGLHQTRSWNLTAWTVGAPKSGIYPKSTFPKGCFEHAAWELFSSWRLMAVGCGILLTNVGTSLTAWPSRWTPHKMLRMEYCRSGLQTHRGNAIVDTLCQSPSEFAILLPNTSIAVVAPRCPKVHHSVEGLHQTRSWNLTAWTLGAPKSGIYPKSIFPKVCFEHAAWELLFMTSDGCGLWHTLDKCGDLFNRMTKQMDTP